MLKRLSLRKSNGASSGSHTLETEEIKTTVVAVFGATGQVGLPVIEALESFENVKTIAISRGRTAENDVFLDECESYSAKVVIVEDYEDVPTMTEVLKGVDVVICATPPSLLQLSILEAAKATGTVKRFLPSEFGIASKDCSEDGEVGIMTIKKKVMKAVQESGLEWTGVFFGFFLELLSLNLMFQQIFGDGDVPWAFHSMYNIGRFTAMVALDPKCANKFVQMDYNVASQNEIIEKIIQHYPDTLSKEDLTITTQNALELQIDQLSAGTTRKGLLTILLHATKGHCVASKSSDLLLGTELYPDFEYESIDARVANASKFFP